MPSPQSPTHWGDVIEKLVASMCATRRARRFDDPDDDLEKLREWAAAWVLKHEPDERALDQMERAFDAFHEHRVWSDPEHKARLRLWVHENIGLDLWATERVRDEEARRRRGS